jgi:hypothetical protein
VKESLTKEKNDLDKRIVDLVNHVKDLKDSGGSFLDKLEEIVDCDNQIEIMIKYSNILNERIIKYGD